MQIDDVIWLEPIIEKLYHKHSVNTGEVEEVFLNSPRIRFIEKGDYPEEDVYMALGQTHSGRYLAVLFIHKRLQKALIISAREMAPKERRAYGKK